MSLPKRHIDINGDMPVRELLRLLDIPGDSVTLLVEGEPMRVAVHTVEKNPDALILEEIVEVTLGTAGTFHRGHRPAPAALMER